MRFRVSRPHKHPKSSIPWFRIAVPKDLRAKIGKSEIKQSLGTTDPSEAQIEFARLTAEWKSRFRALRNETLTEDLARAPELVDQFFKQLADRRHGDLDGAIYALQKLIAVRALTAWGPSEYHGRPQKKPTPLVRRCINPECDRKWPMHEPLRGLALASR